MLYCFHKHNTTYKIALLNQAKLFVKLPNLQLANQTDSRFPLPQIKWAEHNFCVILFDQERPNFELTYPIISSATV